ncbi:MAG TPA: Uma2 family endonuclease [Gemmataceae bacterium]|nr:Uma2 family endonuclease [Gemmataceae bacterium]
MSAALKWNLVSVEDYLDGELHSPIKHEYVGGVVHAMAGASNAHNVINYNTLISIGIRLRGKRCQVHGSDTKVRIDLQNEVRFYYPDQHVFCEPNPLSDSFQDRPVVIFEVLSRSTRRTDLGEKKDAYLTIPSLRVYGLIEQDEPTVIVFRRGPKEFAREVYHGLDAVIPLTEIEIELPLAEIYERIEFSPEPVGAEGA